MRGPIALRGGAGDDRLVGGIGEDSLSGGAGDDDLEGRNQSDLLRGNAGDDVLNGGGGGDTLMGGTGDDTLEGGPKGDVFVFGRRAGNDVITDFEDGSDLIDVSGIGLGGFGQLSAAITTARGNAFIDWAVFGGEGQVTILAAGGGTLDASDFVF